MKLVFRIALWRILLWKFQNCVIENGLAGTFVVVIVLYCIDGDAVVHLLIFSYLTNVCQIWTAISATLCEVSGSIFFIFFLANIFVKDTCKNNLIKQWYSCFCLLLSFYECKKLSIEGARENYCWNKIFFRPIWSVIVRMSSTFFSFILYLCQR